MGYTPSFTPPYENGWQDLPNETTPIQANALNSYDAGIENIEQYLASDDSQSNIAEAYDETATYSKDDYVIHGGNLYKAKQDISTAEEWDSTHWDACIVTDEMVSIAGSTTLEGLADVSITTPSDGQILKYDGTSSEWVNANEEINLTMLGDVDVDDSTLANGQTLIYNSTSEKWENDEIELVTSLSDLSDTAISSASNGQLLAYNGTSQKWANTTVKYGHDFIYGTSDPSGNTGDDNDVYVKVSGTAYGTSYRIYTTNTSGDWASIAIQTIVSGVVTNTDSVSYKSPNRTYPDFTTTYSSGNWRVTITTGNVEGRTQGDQITWTYYASQDVTLVINPPEVYAVYVKSRGIWLKLVDNTTSSS